MSNGIQKIIPVKSCYSHIGGRLGNLLMEQFIEKEWIKKTESNERLYYITTQGKAAFTQMGIDLSLIPVEITEEL
jgi:DNA-binding PadR family transcriptional regulator